MSGIVGILNLNGSPADPHLLGRMTSYLAFRGPDAQRVWTGGPVGFGHTLLRTTDESAAERQPLTFDERVWIVADARLDAREELLSKLTAKGCMVRPSAPDVELILHAYHVWDADCVQHFLGDFAFAIWDVSRQRLFCARDHFGVKPFFHASVANHFLFGNTLRCLRLHPQVSDRLNDSAIADFLLFAFNQDAGATAFADIQRLPPAHTLELTRTSSSLRRYWTLPVEGPIRYKRQGEYVDEFRHLLELAVKDRLRTRSAAVLASGGLDSSTLAATASSVLAQESAPFDLRSYTLVSDHLLPDEERRYSGIVGRALGIPVDYLSVDDYPLYAGWEQHEARPPEPIPDPFQAILYDKLRRVSARHRVAFTGHGGDPVFSTSVTSYAVSLLRAGRFGRLLSDFYCFLAAEGRFSRLYLRTRLRVLFKRMRKAADLPAWLNPAFSARLDLPARWKRSGQMELPKGLLRPAAFQSLQHPTWPGLFESYDPALTAVPVDCRHPYFDLRLIRFVLRIPPVPWCTDKELVRVAMRGVLPEEVRLRPKTPLQGDPTSILLRRSGERWWEKVPPSPLLASYLDWSRVPRLSGNEQPSQARPHLAPHSLNLWLWSLSPSGQPSHTAPQAESRVVRVGV